MTRRPSHRAPLPRPAPRRRPAPESDTVYEVLASLPGVKKENISVEVSRSDSGDNLLTITATRVARERTEDPTLWHRRERVDSTVKRTLTLPANANPGAISSRLENGVLHITLCKMPASQLSAEPRSIPIA